MSDVRQTAMTAKPIRVSLVILDLLDLIGTAPPDNPPWGLRLCREAGHGHGTVYPALDKLLRAGWITGRWEEPQPADRPRRRFYVLTDDGRAGWLDALTARDKRRATWIAANKPGRTGGW